ncbi:MAG: patatin-like phospholipase family protein, partial [Saprospiraceae bacterium]
MRKRFIDVCYSFPIRLFLLHIRSSHLLIGLWLVLALFISGNIGQKLGFRYLFLDPEYLGVVNFWSFFFLGFTFGGFAMTWHLTTYLLTAHHFPFLASLSRPFTKFCINNSIFPLAFLIFYLATLIHFQHYYEELSNTAILLNCLGVLGGAFLLIIFNLLYFYFTNKDIFSFIKVGRKLLPPDLIGEIAPGRRGVDPDYIKMDENRWLVSTYFTETLGVRTVRSVAHYDARLLMTIFKQNHLNALVIQILSMILLMLLGQLIDYTYFRIPAAASLFILGSVILAILGALIYWFDQWWVTLFILLLGAINFITSFEFLHFNNRAYGLNYEVPRATYSYPRLESLVKSDTLAIDKANTIKILENWKRKVKRPGRKPKMVLLCVSGGGLRAATWTVQTLQTADSLTNGKLLDHSMLITGASGGMFGAAYMRELYLRQQQSDTVNLYADRHIENVSKDLLNSVAFTLVSNDLFLPWATFKSGNYRYQKDRGYMFEKQLNENTEHIMDKSIADYREPEAKGLIPMMYITPAIVNDVRRIIISPHGVSFMMMPPVGRSNMHAVEVDAVDFGWLFQQHNAYNLRFLTALRMNATF